MIQWRHRAVMRGKAKRTCSQQVAALQRTHAAVSREIPTKMQLTNYTVMIVLSTRAMAAACSQNVRSGRPTQPPGETVRR